VKTDEQAMALFKHITEFINENPESADVASNPLEAILRFHHPSVLVISHQYLRHMQPARIYLVALSTS